MDINRNNYEAFFLDYAEGNLTAAEEEILHRFLKFNPDLSDELEGFHMYHLESNEEKFPNKAMLKKRFPGEDDLDPGENFDMFCIAYLEGDLTDKQVLLFEQFISENLEFKTKLELYSKTIVPEEAVPFPYKQRLKRRKPIEVNWRIVMSVAAAAAILLMFFIGPTEEDVPMKMAATIEPESTEDAVISRNEENTPPPTRLPATLKVIKDSKAPVPVTDHSKKDNTLKDEKGSVGKEIIEKKPKLASLDLSNINVKEVDAGYDKFTYFSVPPPAVHPRSLSAINMARYQYQRASSAMDEDNVFIWNLASMGLKELNKITGSEAQLLASKDEEGSISGIQFKSRLLNITAPVSRDD